MARARSSNGNGRLEQAMADLAESRSALEKSMRELSQAQAILVQNQAAFLAHSRRVDEAMAETNRANAERFNRIEATLAEHGRILKYLVETVEGLPDAIHTIRDKFGFQPPKP